ncbi:MAG: hypothetical protein ACI4PL_07920 [Faecousia sp.]
MRFFHFRFYPCMQTSRSHTLRLNGTPTIQPVQELVEVKIEENCELIVPAHFHPANHGADYHFLCLDSGRIVQISKGKDLIVLALQLLRDGFRFHHGLNLYHMPISTDGGDFKTNDTGNAIIDAGQSMEIKYVGVVGFEPDDLTAPFEVVVDIINSNGESEQFIYAIK